MRQAVILPLAAFMLASAAEAEIYKCERDGETVFSQTPCAPNAQEVTVKVHTPDPEAAKLAAERAEATNEAVDTSMERRRIEREISDLEDRIRGYERRMDSELTSLRLKKTRAANNTAGATWEQSISDEMSAVTSRYQTKIDSAQRQIDRLRDRMP